MKKQPYYHIDENSVASAQQTLFAIRQDPRNTPEVVYDMIRKYTSEVFKSDTIKEKVSCGGGCSFCCHDIIRMPNTEAKIIREKIVANNSFFDITRANLQKYESSGKKITFQDKACPALLPPDDSGSRKCGIYDFRPLVCIQHNSTEPIENCNKEDDDGSKLEKSTVQIFCEATSILDIVLLLNETKERGVEYTGLDNITTCMHELF